MSKIHIENLGPVKEFDSTVDDKLMLIIGEQASGKSTIAKSIFFCKSVSEEFKKFLLDSNNVVVNPKMGNLTSFRKMLRTKFMEFFGTTKHMDYFIIEYTFDNGETLSIKLDKGYANIIFSNTLHKQCDQFIREVREYYEDLESRTHAQKTDLRLWMNQRNSAAEFIESGVDSIFGQEYTSVFIPAGRSMLSTNSEFFHTLTPNKYDIIMNEFIERIVILQKQYSQRIEDIVEDKKKTSSDAIDFVSVRDATQLVKSILKGDYVNDKNGEKIYYDKDHFVKLIQASSGQQESLWIVLLLFSIILNKQKVFLVIEEPEAHLFPTAQKEILELIILMINATESNVVLTTHSPYILSAGNLMMYSEFVENNITNEKEIIPKKHRLSSEYVSAYMIKDNKVKDIMNRNERMIDASYIDSVSDIINRAMDLLIEKDDSI